ncbi:MAG: SCO family protein [Pseudomonadota bacterium]
MEKKLVWVAAGLLVAMLAGLFAYTALNAPVEERFAQCSQGAVAGGDIGGPFELVSGSGDTVTDTDVITEPSLIYFGYTYCPDVCPLDVYRNGEAVDALAQRGVSATPVFISIDPERDTPDVVAEFADVMHPKMVGLTGTPEQVKAASQAYRTFYRRQAGGGDDYLVDHSTFTYLVLPEHGFVDFFRRDALPEAMAETVACYANASS